MARTTPMRLMELMVLKQDISKVLSYLGRKACFQFQTAFDDTQANAETVNKELEMYRQLDQVRVFLSLPEFSEDIAKYDLPESAD